MKLFAIATLLVVPLALMGPPRITVAAGAPGSPVTVTMEHHDGVDHIDVTAKVFRLVGNQARQSSTQPTAAGGTEFTRSFTLSPRRNAGEAVVMVVRGTHGEDGPFAEALVAFNGDGAVVRIEHPKRKSVIGGFVNPKISDDQVLSTLREIDSN